jgi:type I restriction enzyme R subunit
MINVGNKERCTQIRVIELFTGKRLSSNECPKTPPLTSNLGYTYLGNWQDREGNSNIEEAHATKYLSGAGYTPDQISRALHLLRTAATVANTSEASLYGPNKAVYELLRYGAKVKVSASELTTDVAFIDWDNPEANHFGIAEEVTLEGENNRRPDLVLYVNGIALGVIELKSASVGIGDGIRQCISNQKPLFHRWFFSTVQYLFAGNDSEGLKYGTIETPEKFWLRWKEDEADDTESKLDKYLKKMCAKTRFLELMHDFVLFDGGVKKVPRVHQYFGVKASQERVNNGEGGIIWHTQGSGKSIVMVLLAKWVLENHPNARVAIVTDRTELDKQINRVFTDAGEEIHRTTSGRDLLTQLGKAKPRLLCSLVHKFGKNDVEDFEGFIADLKANPIPVVGDLFLFVDECHRTQSGRLHKTMKAMLPDATFIGFSGTPLRKEDKSTSRQVFGSYIHTYNFGEAVRDKVILDLVYEARDIRQYIGDTSEIDDWFSGTTKGLNDYQRTMLREHWATMQKVLSSKRRIDRVVKNVLKDFKIRPRLSGERGTAMFVASSIYEACRYYDLFRMTALKNRCAVVTSYDPHAGDVSKEDTGTDTDTAKEFVYNTYVELLKNVQPQPGKSKTETYEDEVKYRFREEPAKMKLLIVVDKLLTGFDAPSCTFLYLDKSMQDHGLFQAICRTNRLDGEDKDYGYIIDYKDLFKRVENAIEVYNGELDTGDDGTPPEIALKDRLNEAKKRLDNALEAVLTHCEDVELPQRETQFVKYFCGNIEVASELNDRRIRRDVLYQTIAQLARAYANLEFEMQPAGYTPEEADRIREQVKRYLKLRDIIRLAAAETLDLKSYEADMRDLIDSVIEADAPKKISPFDNLPLLDLIEKLGIHKAMAQLQKKSGGDAQSAAETITHNVRSRIIKGQLTDPAYFEKMSAILDELVKDLRKKRLAYKNYLDKIAELAAKVKAGRDDDTPASLTTPGLRALYYNMDEDESKALLVHNIIRTKRPDDWRGSKAKERVLQRAINDELKDAEETRRVFEIVKKQSEY